MCDKTYTSLIRITRKALEYYQTRKSNAYRKGSETQGRKDKLEGAFLEGYHLGYDLRPGVNDK
tara:strand:+ start:21812 stop:22000 length:189 start_codon:yes stop_codon:yes gene_type:complete